MDPDRGAVSLEDDDPLSLAGDEADAPADSGRPPSSEDIDPPTDDQPLPREIPREGPGGWRVAKCLLDLKAEADARWPNRDRRTDGFIGDDRHCGPASKKTSDHCPNAANVVRAMDIDSDGIDAAWLADQVRAKGKGGDARLHNGGYVVFNKRIASERQGWEWRDYTGEPHQDHLHVSVSRDVSGYDGDGDWGVRNAVITPTPPGPTPPKPVDLPKHEPGSRVLQVENPQMRGTDVGFVQRFVGASDDGADGPKTKTQVERYQGIRGIPQTGIVDAVTWQQMGVG
jgi:hypothetical protein